MEVNKISRNYCNECPYYSGKEIVNADDKNNIIEQCGKKWWEDNKIKHNVKHSSNNNILCAVEQDYHYFLLVLAGEYKSLKKIQLTKEEFDNFEKWHKDIAKLNEIIERKLGCKHCREASIIKQPQLCMDHLETNYGIQADLWRCRYCGTYWEYGVYNCIIVDDSYVDHYFSKK